MLLKAPPELIELVESLSAPLLLIIVIAIGLWLPSDVPLTVEADS